MPNYRRAWVPGGTYFFTVNLLERNQRLLVDYVDLLRVAFVQTRDARPFEMIAAVVLPDHLHCVWQLPPDDADNAARWKAIKSTFSRALPAGERRSPRRVAKGERGIWQRRYWEHLVRDERDLAAHVDYIHFNSVKHGHVSRVEDWPYSTFHRYVRKGVLPRDWAGAAGEAITPGERNPRKAGDEVAGVIDGFHEAIDGVSKTNDGMAKTIDGVAQASDEVDKAIMGSRSPSMGWKKPSTGS